MTLLVALSWVNLFAATVLMGLKLWSWHDTWKDWKAVLASGIPEESSVYQQAKGFRRLARLRVIDGICWLALGVLAWINRFVIPPVNGYPQSLGRWIMLGLIVMEMAKLANDRYTRGIVSAAVRGEK